MTAPIYAFVIPSPITLASGVPKSAISARAPSGGAYGLQLVAARVGFKGVTAANAPVTCDLCRCSFATAGTATGLSGVQESGRAITGAPAALLGAYNYSAEPTVLTVLDSWPVTPVGGLVVYDFPLSTEYDCDANEGFVIRMNAPVGESNYAFATLRVSRI